MAAAASYWCHRCSRFVQIWRNGAIACPDCGTEFVEEVEHPMSRLTIQSNSPNSSSPTAATSIVNNNDVGPQQQQGQITRRTNSDRVNPVVVFRGGGGEGGFELFYDDGAGGGLRRLPPSMSEFLLGSGFERLLEQLSAIENTGVFERYENNNSNAPACKAAIESMPTVVITEQHVDLESHCAVCKEAFELESEAKEMPCKHIYHSDCIIPWLCIRNSCPVCRHQLQADDDGGDGGREVIAGSREGGEVEAVGLTIWRLPGGGYAVGRFMGRREREMPNVYTEVEGGFNNFGNNSNNNVGLVRRRMRRGGNGGRWRGARDQRSSGGGGGVRRVLRQWCACFVGFEDGGGGGGGLDMDSRIRRIHTGGGDGGGGGGGSSHSNNFSGWRRAWGGVGSNGDGRWRRVQ